MATIQLNTFRKSVVLNEHAISRCTALAAEHINRHKYLLANSLSNLGCEGASVINTALCKGVVLTLVLGSGAMICTDSCTRLLSHTLHSFSQFFTSCRPSMTQYWFCTWASTWLTPACWQWLWMSATINWVMWIFFGKIMGCAVS